MKKMIFCLLALALAFSALGQDTAWKTVYRGSATRINDLVHTRLEVRLDYAKSYVYGRVELTLRPHFYPTDSLLLDARQMDIAGVWMISGVGARPLTYEYDGWQLRIRLPRVYRRTESYAVRIVYTAKPAEAKVADDQRGLYFINPAGTDKHKPTQVWTDNEPEKVSLWCPTIDKPNQKTTEEILLTVPSTYVTLSNGRLAGQVHHSDGTRTDDWKMELPHAPYLFFMGVGNFAIIRDSYKGKAVNYYVEPEYAPTARRIFGETPAMMAFFGRVTGVDFPWIKYSQIVVRDLTSRAMENTTATAHASDAQQDERELADGNRWEDNIAHELLHQWFGDYVTGESWSNVTLNEGFARFGEYLWEGYRHGADAAGENNFMQLQSYLGDTANTSKDLVPYYYADADQTFDIAYDKGSLVLNMLRNYLGDSAFFKGINLYLNRYRFQSAEVHQLRLVMEEVSGKDLNWFFDQWYFGSGHPKVTIDYRYDDAAGKVMVVIRQRQGRPFSAPLAVDVYRGALKTSYPVWLQHSTDTFFFPYTTRPDLVNVDAGKSMLWEKTDHKTLANFAFQYAYAGNFVDRREAVVAALRHPEEALGLELIRKGLTDRYAGIRQLAVQGLSRLNDTVKAAFEAIVAGMARHDPNALARRLAIRILPEYPGQKYKSLILAALEDSSYSVAGEALNALGRLDSVAAYVMAKRLLAVKARGTLAEEIVGTLAQYGTAEDADLIAERFAQLSFKPRIARKWVSYLLRLQDEEKVQRGIDILVELRRTSPAFFTPFINTLLGQLPYQLSRPR